MKKKYVLDTNVLLEDENAIEILRNGEENEIYVPATVLEEIDGLKKDAKLSHRISLAVEKLHKNIDYIKVLSKTLNDKNIKNDDKILEEISHSNIEDLIFVSNDKLLRFKAIKKGLHAEEFKKSNPYMAESQKYTGFIEDGENLINNCFYWKEGRLCYNKQGDEKVLNYDNTPWGVNPKSAYQNAMFELMLDNEIDLVTIQSSAGYGKTFCALASALYLVFEKKKFSKIFIFKPNIELGEKLGFLPGDVDEKMEHYFRPIKDLIIKLHESRQIPKAFVGDPKSETFDLNKRKIEMLPINYLRGMNLENSVVIVDECQNLSRAEMRTILSRMGEKVKCFCLGDVQQIDNPYLNESNNGLNWVVVKAKGSTNFGHVVLKGNKSRGPIADLVRNIQL